MTVSKSFLEGHVGYPKISHSRKKIISGNQPLVTKRKSDKIPSNLVIYLRIWISYRESRDIY